MVKFAIDQQQDCGVNGSGDVGVFPLICCITSRSPRVKLISSPSAHPKSLCMDFCFFRSHLYF